MRRMYTLGFFIVLLNVLTSCNGQTKDNTQTITKNTTEKSTVVGGGCDGCELMYVGMPTNLKAVDTSAGWTKEGQKLLVTGTVFKLDGKTPAPNVIIYYWQTDNNGYYSPREGLDEKAKTHGSIRGWIKTDENGKYAIYTIRPAPYPNDVLPAHIHLSIKEPAIANEYYPDDINFDDDTLLLPYFKKYPQENRGGSGVVRIQLKGDIQIAARDIILGLNIPNYPKTSNSEKKSGVTIGEDQR
jgi:protocatechuate 3,4-dioxygenase beta subunit